MLRRLLLKKFCNTCIGKGTEGGIDTETAEESDEAEVVGR